MRFVKMEAIGNDFVVVEGPRPIHPSEVVAWCDRRRGIGADGVLLVEPTGLGGVRMAYWNADGTASEMCGNGMRCVARYAVEAGWAPGPEVKVEGPTGSRTAIVGATAVTVELGPVQVDAEPFVLAGIELTGARVGNPHAVTFVDATESAPVRALGSQIAVDPRFPDGTNVEFAALRGDRLDLRVWERGVGETLACGSGAAAAVAVAQRRGWTGDEVTVKLPGGELLVEMRGGSAWLTGPARRVFTGELAPA